MKKYFYIMLVVLAAGFASCSNDDIPMEEDVTMKTFETTFKINPQEVVSSLTFEYFPGQLTVVPSDAQLRIRILIYDSNGKLVDILTNKQSNYQSVWSVKKYLETGIYKALVVSDVINLNNSDVTEYWTLSDYHTFNSVKLVKNPNWLGYQKEILGTACVNFSVDESSKELSIDLSPAGAVCYVWYEGFKTFSDITDIDLWTNQKFEYYNWNSNGELLPNVYIDMEDYVDIVSGIQNFQQSDNDYHCSIIYLLPTRNQYFQFKAKATDGNEYWFGDGEVISEIKAGEQYFFADFISEDAIEDYSYNVTGMTWEEFVMQEFLSTYSASRSCLNMPLIYHDNSYRNNSEVYLKELLK